MQSSQGEVGEISPIRGREAFQEGSQKHKSPALKESWVQGFSKMIALLRKRFTSLGIHRQSTKSNQHRYRTKQHGQSCSSECRNHKLCSVFNLFLHVHTKSPSPQIKSNSASGSYQTLEANLLCNQVISNLQEENDGSEESTFSPVGSL